MTIDLDSFERLASARRSSLLVDRDRPVPDEVVDRLCRLVFLAPNHKRTAPWQVAAVTGAGRDILGERLCEDIVGAGGAPAAKLDKTRVKYLRAPVVIVVGCRADDDSVRHREDEAAVAAGIENLLLGAAAGGLTALWSSPPVVASPAACSACGFADGTELVGLVYLGWPATSPPPAQRAVPVVNWVRH